MRVLFYVIALARIFDVQADETEDLLNSLNLFSDDTFTAPDAISHNYDDPHVDEHAEVESIEEGGVYVHVDEEHGDGDHGDNPDRTSLQVPDQAHYDDPTLFLEDHADEAPAEVGHFEEGHADAHFDEEHGQDDHGDDGLINWEHVEREGGGHIEENSDEHGEHGDEHEEHGDEHGEQGEHGEHEHEEHKDTMIFDSSDDFDVASIALSMVLLIAFTVFFEKVVYRLKRKVLRTAPCTLYPMHCTDVERDSCCTFPPQAKPYPHFTQMLHKIIEELTILGFLSFTLTILVQSNCLPHNSFLVSFEFSHVLIFFVACLLVIQGEWAIGRAASAPAAEVMAVVLQV
jgi:hypothetical protein